MATYNPRRFAGLDQLKSIKPELLMRFFSTYRTYFSIREFDFPSHPNDEIDYQALSLILVTPDDNTPPDMVNALYYVQEMATTNSMDVLLEACRQKKIWIDFDPESTSHDIAIQVWLAWPDLLMESHARNSVSRKKSFVYFAGKQGKPLDLSFPTAEQLRAIEHDLDAWLEEHRRGRTSRVFVSQQAHKVHIVIRHGKPFTREGSVKTSGSSSVAFYRPETHDFLIYESQIDEIAVHAETIGERSLYLACIGKHVFGDETYFPPSDRFTLQPLIDKGPAALTCEDIPGLERVRFVEYRKYLGGEYGEFETRGAKDTFRSSRRKASRVVGLRPARASRLRVRGHRRKETPQGHDQTDQYRGLRPRRRQRLNRTMVETARLCHRKSESRCRGSDGSGQPSKRFLTLRPVASSGRSW